MHKIFKVAVRGCSCLFTINGKYNILMGESGIGKTRLSKVIDELQEKREMDAMTVVAPPEPGILARTIEELHGACIVIDESVDAVTDSGMMSQIISSDNYYIFISRESLATVPYGIRNVFTLEGGPNHYRMRPMYNKIDYHKKGNYDVLVCEDAASGFDIIKDHFQPHGYSVHSAGGKNNVSREIREHWLNENVLILADLCGLDGAIMDIMELVQAYPNIGLYDSPSFEYELLAHPLINREDLRDLSDEDIMKYASEEAYYTQIVADVLNKTYGITYDKSINAAVTFLNTGHLNNAHYHLNFNYSAQTSNWLYPDIPR